MRGPNIHVVFSPKKNFQGLQLHQTFIFFSEFWRNVKIIAFSTKVCPRFSKIFLVYLLFVLVFFQKYSLTSVHKNPNIYANNH